MQEYDLIIRNGTLYDGSGSAPVRGDLAINGDMIAALGDIGEAKGKHEIDVNGLAVAPGFINMLSWSVESLIADGRSQSEIRQGVTLEILGEGSSMGPLTEEMKTERKWNILGNSHIQYEMPWTTLGEYLEYLEQRGVSTNIASFVGTSTLRINAMGYDNREPTPEELKHMRALTRQAMAEGAVGLSAALIYPPASYADTDEIIELASAAAEYDGLYISHIRNEGSAFLPALEEFIEIAEVAKIRAEIYHLKSSGSANWHMMDSAIELIEAARAKGLPITADMYQYPYAGTGLAACIPPWAHEGGHPALVERLQDPVIRQRLKQELQTPSNEWENMFLANGPDNIMLCGFQTEGLKPLTGKTLSQVAAERGTPPEDTLMDLLVEDNSRIFTMYFCMSEDNLRKQMALPWVSFCSDAESQAPEGVFLKVNPHPRAYGSFARVVGKYVRDEQIIPLEEAVRRLTRLPATNLKLDRRGALEAGYFADVVVFDPALVQDHATPENPHQYSTGMVHVFVNGTQVLENGEHTGATPGRFVRGPGWKKQPFENLYPPALHPLLTLGEQYKGSYEQYGRDLIPDLIRLATDERMVVFYEREEPQAYAPMHAMRRLGQLGALAAVEPMLSLLITMNPYVMRELPLVYGMIGMKAFPALMNYFTNPHQLTFARIGALTCMRVIGQQSNDAGPKARLLLEGLVIDQLRQYRENEPYFNSALVLALTSMQSRAAVELLVEVYNANAVMVEVAGKFEDVMAKLGIKVTKEAPAPARRDDTPSLAVRAERDDKKKKAKRKQADKMKKLNRRK